MFMISEHNKKVNTTMDKPERDTKEEILKRALEAFKKTGPEQAQVETLEWLEDTHPAGFRPDVKIRMLIGRKAFDYYAIIRTAVTKTQRLLMLVHREKLQYPLLLIAKYVNGQMAQQLREYGIEFIDTVGNAFINQPPIYIFVTGNRPPEIAMRAPLGRAFKAAGLRMIYLFLCNPGFEHKTYREIAAATGVALGTVDWTMRELKHLGFLLDMGKRGHKLIQKEILLERWVTAYPEQLRPKQMLGRYRGEHGWWRHRQFDPLTAQWGAEVAAARLTQYLEPEIITIYTTTRQLNHLLLENRLRKDPRGDVELLERFWKEPGQYNDLVHPVLIYADLLATGNQRDIDTAKMVYEQHIIRLIRED